jgi:hypothetical protein
MASEVADGFLASPASEGFALYEPPSIAANVLACLTTPDTLSTTPSVVESM